jgi:hypothetical protein
MNFNLTAFKIEFLFDRKKYKATVEQTALSDSHETFTVTGGSKSIQIKSNRPFLKAKGLKKKISWKVIDGQVKHKVVLEEIILAIEYHLYRLEHPPFNWQDHPKNSKENMQ